MTSRRAFLKASTLSLTAAGSLAAQNDDPSLTIEAPKAKTVSKGNPVLKIALVGSGGRGRGAAVQALKADPDTQLVAVCDAFPEPLESGLRIFQGIEGVADRVDVPEERQYVGLDCCERMLAEVDVDVVLLCSPPFFRPSQYEACIEAGKHVFAEKPVATDVVGIKQVMETSRKAAEKGLSVVSGLCWRYETGLNETVDKIREGLIGKPTSAFSVRYSGLVGRVYDGQTKTDFEHQLRNWYFYTWLSGDFIVEQFVHDLDMVAYAIDEYPTSCIATGGRETRPDDQGNIFDHFSALFTFDSGLTYQATTRHMNGTAGQYYNRIVGSGGQADLMRYKLTDLDGKRLFHRRKPITVMHQLEHDAMYAALRKGERIDNSEYMTKSTLMGILARESAYTGKILTMEELLASDLSLQPAEIAWDAEVPPPTVATPGVTTLDRGQTA